MDLQELKNSIEQYCLFTDVNYTLSSGKQGNFYYDMKRLLLSAEYRLHIARALLDRTSDLIYDVIGGKAIGSILLSEPMAVVAALERNNLYDTFYVRADAKDHGTEDQVVSSIFAQYPNVIAKDLTTFVDRQSVRLRVLLVDDVMTTGNSMMYCVKLLEERNCDIVSILSIIERTDVEDPVKNLLKQKYDYRTIFKTADGDRNLVYG